MLINSPRGFWNARNICVLLLSVICGSYGATPVVIWHGIGDVCCDPLSLGGLQKFIEETVPGIYVKSLKIGKSIRQDFENAYFMNVNKQVEFACQAIKSDERLQQGYHALGISQGGQFLRAVAQRCPEPPMRNLVTMGSQHQGVYGFPRCPGDNSTICNYARELLSKGAYKQWIQDLLVPAQYWHDPMDEELYVERSLFLADINNERAKNETYKNNLQKLENFVMVKFTKDTIVDPIATEWFGFYEPGQEILTFTLQESKLYQEDWLGLQAMDQAGKLQFYAVEGDHIQFSRKWFAENIIQNYFK